jgi:ATP-dependent Clp protease ATP-binding subunit ClpA
VIGATTGEEYDKWIRQDPALERRFQPVTIEELDAIQTWEVLVARRPRFERHHAVAIADDALKAAIVLTDRFVSDRARPDKAIDVLDEACAHAQATAHVSPELDRLIRERRKIEALIKRGLTEERPPDAPMPDLGAVLDQVVADFREMMGGASASTPPPAAAAVAQPRAPTLAERRAEFDRLLHEELERQGIVVSGRDVARVVGLAVGKGIEWAG